MSDTKHTSGPWPLEYTGDGKRIVVGRGLVEGPGGYEIAEVYSDDCPRELAWANANLIGAAPDLLAALKGLVEPYNGFNTRDIEKRCDPATFPRVMGAFAAIAKAESRAS